MRLIAFSREDVFGTHPQKLVRTCRYLKLEIRLYPLPPEVEGGRTRRALVMAQLPEARAHEDGGGGMRNMFEKFRQVSGIYQWERRFPEQVFFF